MADVTPDADVVVVGGGPAGSAAALLLARRGRDVLLLDRASFPRPKPCGDCLSAGATALLRRLAVLDPVLAGPHAVLRGWRIVSPNGALFESLFDHDDELRGALVVERSHLDSVLLEAARAAGVRVVHDTVTDVLRSGRRVTGVRTRAGDVRTRLLIGADGLRSVIAARLGLRRRPGAVRKLSLTYHFEHVVVTDGVGEMHVGDGFCAGVAPVSSARSNLTVVVDADRFGRDIAADAPGTVRALLQQLPRLRERAARLPLADVEPRASGPFDRPVSRIAVDGAVLVGDAAGYYDPFTGQGVYQALASAELLADCAHRALVTRWPDARAFASYVRDHARLISGARRVQRGIEAVLSRPAIANRAIARIARAPRFGSTILGVTGDVLPASSLLAGPALASLFFPVVPETT